MKHHNPLRLLITLWITLNLFNSINTNDLET